MKKILLIWMATMLSFDLLAQTDVSWIANPKYVVSYGIAFDSARRTKMDLEMQLVEFQVEQAELALYFDERRSFSYIPTHFDENVLEQGIAKALLLAKSSHYYDKDSGKRYKAVIEKKQQEVYELSTPITWQLFDSTQHIQDRLCYYAEGVAHKEGFSETKYKAWYTKSIPLPFGPEDTYGLPGLIMKINIGGFKTYTVRNVYISEEQGLPITFPTEAQPLKEEDFIKTLIRH